MKHLRLIIIILFALFFYNKAESAANTSVNLNFTVIEDIIKLIDNLIENNQITKAVKVIKTERNKKFTLNAAAGQVIINTYGNNEVNIKIFGNDKTEKNIDFQISETSDGISLTSELKKNSGKTGGANIKYEISVPTEYNIQISNKGGNIEVSDLTGDVDIKTLGGNLKLKNIRGDINGRSLGGNIAVDGFDGNINVKTNGGNISLDGKNGAINAITLGGNITLDYTGENQGMDLSTSAGSIVFNLPAGINGELDLSTTAGRIKSDFSEFESKFVSARLNSKINEGGKIIKAITSAGNITLKKK